MEYHRNLILIYTPLVILLSLYAWYSTPKRSSKVVYRKHAQYNDQMKKYK